MRCAYISLSGIHIWPYLSWFALLCFAFLFFSPLLLKILFIWKLLCSLLLIFPHFFIIINIISILNTQREREPQSSKATVHLKVKQNNNNRSKADRMYGFILCVLCLYLRKLSGLKCFVKTKPGTFIYIYIIALKRKGDENDDE